MTDLQAEPKNEVINCLRTRLTDYNATARVPASSNWIYPDFPRLDFKKDSYPRISVTDVTETAKIFDIGRNMEYKCVLQIDVWVWDGIDGKDSMLLTITSVVHDGQKLLDLISRDVISALDDNKADFDNDTNWLHDFELRAKVDMGPDKDRKQVIRKLIEVGFTYYR